MAYQRNRTNSNSKKTARQCPTPTEAILESISDGVFTVNDNWTITSFNRAAEEITGISREEAVGQHCSDVFRSSMCEVDCALRETLKTSKPRINQSCFIIRADGQRIPISVSTAVLYDESGKVIGGAETFRDLSEVAELRKQVEGGFQIGDLISRSPAMRKIFEILPAVASSFSTVLIQGETGTGKELVARALHSISPRKDQPFIAVNCASLPDSLLESELFGYKAGAFTDAKKDKPGRFALAEGGTLFLDEIAEISMAVQAKLLRVLQDKKFEPLGAIRPQQADVRVIAATNKDLAVEVKSGNFREDLFYRIHVVRIDLPPLRERKEDIPLLTEHFVQQFNRLQGKEVAGVAPEVMTLLMAHSWPGNVRELENAIERCFVLCSRESIDVKHLPEQFSDGASQPSIGLTMRSTKKILERHSIQAALKRNNYNRLAAARELGVHKTTLFRKMKTLGIAVPSRGCGR